MCMSFGIVTALRQAIASARADAGVTGWFDIRKSQLSESELIEPFVGMKRTKEFNIVSMLTLMFSSYFFQNKFS